MANDPPVLFPTKADEPRIDTLRWRTKPGSTPSDGGRNPDRPPPGRDPPPPRLAAARSWRTTPPSYSLPRRTNPGSTPSDGGPNPDRHPQMADEPRIDTLGWRTKPGSTPSDGGRNPDRPPPGRDPPPPRLAAARSWRTKPGSTPSGGGRTPDRPPPGEIHRQPGGMVRAAGWVRNGRRGTGGRGSGRVPWRPARSCAAGRRRG